MEAPITVATTFNDASKVLTVWKWVATTSNWAFYTPAQDDGGMAYAAGKGYDFLTTINAGDGFWINAKIPFDKTLPAGDTVKSSSFQVGDKHALGSGWSLIAVGDKPTPNMFNTGLSPIPPAADSNVSNLTTLWAWDTNKSGWYFWAPNLFYSGGLTAYLTSKGYLDFTTMPTVPLGTLSPGTGFWVNRP